MTASASAYDICVIGGGSGGLTAARVAAGFGVRTLLVDDRPGGVGGECLFSGCVPSKALIAASKHNSGSPDAFTAALHAVQTSIGKVQSGKDNDDNLRKAGVEVLHGKAVFSGPRQITVGEQTIMARKFIIATGSSAFIPPIKGIDEVEYLTNETVFSLAVLPPELLVLGGGPIGVELGQAFARLGSKVTIISSEDRLLPREEPVASTAVQEGCEALGITVILGSKAEAAQTHDGAIELSYRRDADEAGSASGSHLLVATGRKPNTNLNLNAAGIETTPKGITVDKHFRTSNRYVYAVGDCTPTLQFTHVAGAQAGIAVRNALFPGNGTYDTASVPWVTFCQPEIARRGPASEECQAHGGRTIDISYDGIDKAITEQSTGSILLQFDRSDIIIGFTIIGPAAGEVAAQLNLAIDNHLPLSRLASARQAYPTLGFGIYEALAFEQLKGYNSNRFIRWLAKR
jgi:pyruvate/2-oxoglutarate dehydrogenase complex dihydrolipoamide dehydrogenase (E3) component